MDKHTGCEVCEKLTDKYSCIDRFLVYKFTCQICNQSYIGQTARTLKARFVEHKNSLNRGDDISALSMHASIAHSDVTLSMDSFDLEILHQGKTPLESRLIEIKMINLHKPYLNRKHEAS